ncbi:hypothetical protein GCM10029976_025650 [Kribbella albertanoniae]|uniref:Antibiotic biosynthesis monooxygenase n=1 Tax=Kribbella albertanoniae TaxID=1266829 RepID=A0A4R4P873_9ACTN|nr:antibiotic biosynthesis monooxygenase [Kribbella albertanoniae]TDC17093.1 antibiotic biosynthesis monooxygenase [Kribbella albertanoniae]
MIVRIWRTGLDESRADEYETFAYGRSLPMFQRQPGFRGVFFVRTATGRASVTLWADLESAEALANAPEYHETVAAIRSTGFLQSPQSVELLPADKTWIAPDLTTP